MRHTSGIWGIGLEPDPKDIVFVIPSNMKIIRIRLVVFKKNSRKVQLWHMLRFLDCKAVETLAHRRIGAEICYS